MPGHLCGYEASEMDEYSAPWATSGPLSATDARHYNAWCVRCTTTSTKADLGRYGMGLVYMKQGKLRHAEHHFRRASEINPTNPVLLCCIGQVRPRNCSGSPR